jgi:hypothetical protein
MDPTITQEILNDLIPSLEALEAKSTAVLEFLKREGIASDEKLAPYLEQAANASNVRWLGVRVRIARLLSAAEKHSAEKRSDKDETKPEATQAKAAEAIQSRPAAADNSKSAGPENTNPETMRNHTESKSNDSANDSIRNDKNDERVEISEDKSKSAATAAERKVA